MKKAIVVGCDVGGYGVIRALAQHRVPIVALNYDTVLSGNAPAWVSLLEFERIRTPHPGRAEDDFVRCLMQHADDWSGSILLDSDDDGAVAISRHKETLAEHYHIVTADWSVLRQFIEKKNTWRLAERLGVPHPRTFLPTTSAQLGQPRAKSVTRAFSSRSWGTSSCVRSARKISRPPITPNWPRGTIAALPPGKR